MQIYPSICQKLIETAMTSFDNKIMFHVTLQILLSKLIFTYHPSAR